MVMRKYDGVANCFKEAIFLQQENNYRLNQLVFSYYKNDDYINDFDCSLFSFCPDVCCNHTDILVKNNIIFETRLKEYFRTYTKLLALASMGVISDYFTEMLDLAFLDILEMESNLTKISSKIIEKCKEDDENPCKGFGNSTCQLSFHDNKNMNDLKKNSINVTCECDPGFYYSSQTDSCQDIDECESSLDNICYKYKDQMCLNTFGGYICLCRNNGYKLNKSTGLCQRDEITIYDRVIEKLNSIETNR